MSVAPDPPGARLKLFGVAFNVKLAGAVTVNDTVADWITEPLVAVTVTL